MNAEQPENSILHRRCGKSVLLRRLRNFWRTANDYPHIAVIKAGGFSSNKIEK
ncbi:MAG: hypothetical protein J6Z82_09555 [Schwartzia sp.]|nr:hypothetical protein [Schwartzia sp. (in: firmicutes)]